MARRRQRRHMTDEARAELDRRGAESASRLLLPFAPPNPGARPGLSLLNMLGNIPGSAGMVAGLVAPFVERVVGNAAERKRMRGWLETLDARMTRIAKAVTEGNVGSAERLTLEAQGLIVEWMALMAEEEKKRTTADPRAVRGPNGEPIEEGR